MREFFAARDSINAFPAAVFPSCFGVNHRCPMSSLDDLVPGDLYKLRADAWNERLIRVYDRAGSICFAPVPPDTTPLRPVYACADLIFVSWNGQTARATLLTGAGAYVAPRTPLLKNTEYELVAFDPVSDNVACHDTGQADAPVALIA